MPGPKVVEFMRVVWQSAVVVVEDPTEGGATGAA